MRAYPSFQKIFEETKFKCWGGSNWGWGNWGLDATVTPSPIANYTHVLKILVHAKL